MAGKILILEDDRNSALAYEKVLSHQGNTVTICETFTQARKQLLEDTPDAVLTDVRVGEYNGLQLAMLFRRQSPNGRIVVVTGYDDTAIRREVGALGGEFLLKPVAIAALRSAFA